VLAKYVAEVVEKGLDNLADNGGDVNAQVALANRIISTIMTETKEREFDELSVAQRAEQLLALFDKRNSILALDEKTEIIRPETSIAQSSLFTGAIHEPQMYTELKKEIVSCNRIDMLVSFIKWSGLRLIIDALARLKEVGADFRVVFIGSGADEEEVRTYCAAQGLRNRCFFPGAITEREILRAWYCRADALLFPSTFDTNGLVGREAAACSLPAVLVGGSCAAEGTRDGEDAFLVEETAQSLSALLAKRCSDRPRMRVVGEQASRTLYLSWEDAVGRAAERYEIVIDAYRSGKTPHHGGGVEHLLRSQGELMEAVARMGRRKAVRRGGICGENRGRMSHSAGSLRYRVIR
jgi:glycosyltransferase involved in cell wall biosynthesis